MQVILRLSPHEISVLNKALELNTFSVEHMAVIQSQNTGAQRQHFLGATYSIIVCLNGDESSLTKLQEDLKAS